MFEGIEKCPKMDPKVQVRWKTTFWNYLQLGHERI